MKALAIAVFILLGGILATAADRELTGRVVDANTGEPVVRAHITLRFYQGGQQAPELALLTDADGTFKVTGLPAGGFQVFCEKAGYLPANQGVAGAPPGNAPAGQNSSTMLMRLTAQAAIEGIVVDDRNLPAENAYVQLVVQQVVNGRRQTQITGGTTADETGHFRIFALPAGRYYVSVAGRLSGARRAMAVAYAPFYYPNAGDLAGAQPIELKAGDDAEIKIRLPEPSPAFQVSGTVNTTSQNVNVGLLRQTAGSSFTQNSGDLKWDPKTASFKISHVTPGVYLLQAMVPQDRGFTYAGTTITVSNTDVTGVRLDPVEIGVDGTVRMEDGSSTQRIAGYVTAQSDHFNGSGPADAEGKFHIPNLRPGTYRIVPQVNGSQTCLRSVMAGGRDVRDGMTISAGVAPDPLDIVLSSHCGSIDVSVTPSDTPLPPNLTAYLLRKVGDEFVLEKQGFQGMRANDGGAHFLISGVAAGDYVVYVWPGDAQIEYANADYMRQFSSYGQTVTVTDDSKTPVTIDKVLLPAKN